MASDSLAWQLTLIRSAMPERLVKLALLALSLADQVAKRELD
jgi:hypothetical protein